MSCCCCCVLPYGLRRSSCGTARRKSCLTVTRTRSCGLKFQLIRVVRTCAWSRNPDLGFRDGEQHQNGVLQYSIPPRPSLPQSPQYVCSRRLFDITQRTWARGKKSMVRTHCEYGVLYSLKNSPLLDFLMGRLVSGLGRRGCGGVLIATVSLGGHPYVVLARLR